MVADPLKIPEYLRPWHYAGISCFLARHAIAFSPSHPVSGVGSVSGRESSRFSAFSATDLADGHAQPGRIFSAPPAPHFWGGRPDSDACKRASGVNAVALPASDSRPAGEMDNSSSGSFIASGKGKNLPADPALGRPLAEDGIISVWPAPWKEIFGRTIRAPLLWTYRELGRDLTGQGNPDRAKFLRDLISCLDLPRGSNAFWPVSLASDADAPTDDAAAISREEQLIFYQGVQLIRPLLVIFFGTECADMAVLGFGDLSPFSFRIKDGALYIFFPSLQYLLANSAAVGLCADFLLHVFTEFPSLDEQVRRHRNQ